jgi:hypothetical protein
MEKVAQKCGPILSFSKRLSKVNFHPVGENFPNLATLFATSWIIAHFSPPRPYHRMPRKMYFQYFPCIGRYKIWLLFALNAVSELQGCQMIYFETQNTNFGKFCSVLQ